jgi:hypothetical protein
MARLAKDALLSNQLAEIQDYKKKLGENKELRNLMLQVIEQVKVVKAIEREEDRLDDLKVIFLNLYLTNILADVSKF